MSSLRIIFKRTPSLSTLCARVDATTYAFVIARDMAHHHPVLVHHGDSLLARGLVAIGAAPAGIAAVAHLRRQAEPTVRAAARAFRLAAEPAGSQLITLLALASVPPWRVDTRMLTPTVQLRALVDVSAEADSPTGGRSSVACAAAAFPRARPAAEPEQILRVSRSTGEPIKADYLGLVAERTC